MMKWFKFEHQEEETTNSETQPILVYLSPEALEKIYVIDDFSSFQNTPDCVPGGRLFEVSRQYTYNLRQVADLVEEPFDDESLKNKSQSKRDFHSEIKPAKRLPSKNENIEDSTANFSSSDDVSFLESKEDSKELFESDEKLSSENVPFKDLESLFVK